ncbi:MAG: DNA-binding response regulator [Bacteroidetes bacterium HGW-Bacteroidetes-8]|jgi:two-component system LytT family response regulator|nr:MAG: DNA-binding response regulator [Bacteroidetes bacterium HGW-Bacteroidetes-8]
MQEKYSAVVVDDERLARQRLIRLLNKFDNVEIVGEAYDVTSAKRIIESLSPDIVFLDIQMPKQSGFDLLEQINYEGRVVFVSAYDNFALRAFDVNAFDYLVKPVSEDRIEKMLDRLSKDEGSNISCQKFNYEDKIFISDNKFMKFVNLKEIILIQSTGNYSKIFINNGEKHLLYRALKDWESRLPSNKFCRIHRTSIVNIDYVEKLEKWFNYSFRVYITGFDVPVMMSKTYSSVLRSRFS